MTCPICDQEPANCDCTDTERRQYSEIRDMQDTIAALRLTDGERDAIHHAVVALDQAGTEWTCACAATLRALLARLA